MTRHVEVIAVEGPVSIQDLGRTGRRADTLPSSGAADQAAHRLANRIVGNLEDAATLECAYATIRLRCVSDQLVALCGAERRVEVWGTSRPMDRGGTGLAFAVHAGEELVIGHPTSGLRSYLAVRGGIDATPTLGSRSWDSLSRLGPRPPTPGDLLPVGDLVDPSAVPLRDHSTAPLRSRDEIPLDPGPHLDLLDPPARRALGSVTMTVGARADRIGLQLDEILTTGLPADLPSFPVLPGSLQIPPDGRPLLLGRDCGVTGGYPVVGVVPLDALDLVGQLRPGDRFRFRLGPKARSTGRR